MISKIIVGALGGILSHLGVKGGEKVLSAIRKEDSSLNSLVLDKIETGVHVDLPSNVEEQDRAGEPPRLLTRQRIICRDQLAKTKWNWLLLLSYYHPVLGRTTDLPKQWNPKEITGHFLVTDFASQDVAHESEFGEYAQSEVRLKLIHGSIQIANILKNAISLIEKELHRHGRNLGYPDIPWIGTNLDIQWISFMNEIRSIQFPRLPNLNSYCGFKSLWTVQDTAANGIRLRSQKDNVNLYAYSSVIEIASLLIRPGEVYAELYHSNLARKHPLPHQYALRRVASRVLKDVWNANIKINQAKG